MKTALRFIMEEINMQQYNNQVLTGERALFMTDGARIENCTFEDGESPLKESRNLVHQ